MSRVTAARGLLVAAVVAGAIAVTAWVSSPRVPREQTERVASRFAADLLTFGHETLDDDARRMRAHGTPELARRLDRSLRSDGAYVREALGDGEASSAGSVLAADVVDGSRDEASVIVVARQTITRRGSSATRSALRVLTLALVRTPDGWRVDDVTGTGAVTAETR